MLIPFLKLWSAKRKGCEAHFQLNSMAIGAGLALPACSCSPKGPEPSPKLKQTPYRGQCSR